MAANSTINGIIKALHKSGEYRRIMRKAKMCRICYADMVEVDEPECSENEYTVWQCPAHKDQKVVEHH